MNNERWCPNGQHWRKPVYFRIGTNSKVARDCMDCERAARERRNATPRAIPSERMDGVDINAIHYKRGLVAKHLRSAR